MRDIHSNGDNPELNRQSSISSPERVEPTDNDKKKLSVDDTRRNLFDEDSAREGWKKEAEEYRNRAHEDPRYQNSSGAEREAFDEKIEAGAVWRENGRRGEDPNRPKEKPNGTTGENDSYDERSIER